LADITTTKGIRVQVKKTASRGRSRSQVQPSRMRDQADPAGGAARSDDSRCVAR